jgi:hypothetical protein
MPRCCSLLPEVVEVQPELAEARVLDGLVPVPAVVRPQQPPATRADEHAALRPSLGPAPQMVTKIRHDRRGHPDLAHTVDPLRHRLFLDHGATAPVQLARSGAVSGSGAHRAITVGRRHPQPCGLPRRPGSPIRQRPVDHPSAAQPRVSLWREAPSGMVPPRVSARRGKAGRRRRRAPLGARARHRRRAGCRRRRCAVARRAGR